MSLPARILTDQPETETVPHLTLVPNGPAVALDEPDAEVEEHEEEVAYRPADDVDLLRTYVRQIGSGPLLTADRERALARRKDAGDEEAKRRLVECNLRL